MRVVWSSPKVISCIHQTKRQHPPPGFVKIKLDGALESTMRIAVVGAITRDTAGQVLGGMDEPSPGCVETMLSKIHALNATLSLASEYQWMYVIFESDSTLVVNKMSRPEEDLSTLGYHLKEARRILDVCPNIITSVVSNDFSSGNTRSWGTIFRL
ncbi:uncharacterized protein LOC120154210 [Hibiscus syriacus]|uniref:uncharacterized protein LOC120154210 n=1 Tax=Hibiscus syriacus TaxID=106335 RepID=UPI00192445DB|nr:uncharacterized protein LOC120154210 [Hibiscus syriacus]